jgi:hypothetical protein
VIKRPKRRARTKKRPPENEPMAPREDAIPPMRLTVDELWEAVRRLGPPVPGDSVKMIREDRDRH